jgi:hypothetical protein
MARSPPATKNELIVLVRPENKLTFVLSAASTLRRPSARLRNWVNRNDYPVYSTNLSTFARALK